MSKQVRTFIAVELSRAARQKLDKIKDTLRDCSLAVKWVEQYNLHLTLKFLGSINQEKIETVKEELAEVAADKTEFELQFEGLGAFPNLDYPKVVWAGVETGSRQLTELHEAIEERMTALGFDPERHSFTPHVTLGRVKKDEDNLEPLSEKLKEFPFQVDARDEVTKITLMKSELTPRGPNYTPLAEFELSS